MLDILERLVRSCGYTFRRMDGSTSVGSRQYLINCFNEVRQAWSVHTHACTMYTRAHSPVLCVMCYLYVTCYVVLLLNAVVSATFLKLLMSKG